MKRIALMFVVLAACKASSSGSSPPAADPAPTVRAPMQPDRAAPSLPEEAEAGSAGSGERPHLPTDHKWGGRGRDRMAKMDTNGDGVVSDEERAAAMKQRAESMRARADANGDGRLTIDELKAAPGRMRFDDPAALDTNKDGDISADELAAGMQARRDAMRARRDGSDGSATP